MENAVATNAVPTFSTPAIFGLIFAVLAWTVLPVMGMVMSQFNIFNMIAMPLSGSVIASLCAWMAQRRIARSNGMLRGAGLAKAARIMAWTQYALFALVLAFFAMSMVTGSRFVHQVTIPATR